MILALMSLRPNAQWKWVGTDYNDLEWLDEDQTKPTLAEIEVEALRLQQVNSYVAPRQTAYPSITDQLDMLWHAIDAGTLNKTSEFYTTLKAVKDQYPKSE